MYVEEDFKIMCRTSRGQHSLLYDTAEASRDMRPTDVLCVHVLRIFLQETKLF